MKGCSKKAKTSGWRTKLMSNDLDFARRALDFQARAKDYNLTSLPGYKEWSNRKLDQGESPAFIAHLDAMSMWLLPEDVSRISDSEFEQLLVDVKISCQKMSGPLTDMK
jgi:hypothetical protein